MKIIKITEIFIKTRKNWDEYRWLQMNTNKSKQEREKKYNTEDRVHQIILNGIDEIDEMSRLKLKISEYGEESEEL